MPVFIVAFVVGVCALQQMAQLPDSATTWLIAAAGASGCLVAMVIPRLSKSALARRRWVQAAHACALVVCGITLGYAWAAFQAQARLSDALPMEWEGRDIALTGVVASLPEPGESSLRFDLDVEASVVSVPSRLRLSRYRDVKLTDIETPMRAGERWRLVVRLKRPHGQVNPHGFDYEAHLFERGIRATGYVRTGSAELLDAQAEGWRYAVVRLRQNIRDRFYAALPGQEGLPSYSGVLVALAVGDQSAIPTAQWQVFARTGITHLMSISGLHVTMLAALAYALAAFVWRNLARRGGRWAVGLLNWPLAPVCSLVGLCVAAAYCALAGFGVPAQRTLYMLTVATLALWSRRNVGFLPGLTLALWVVVVLDPWAVLSAGFWLSFVAVAILLWTAKAGVSEDGSLGQRARRVVGAWGQAQWAVTVMTLPMLLALFGQFSLISPLANAFAIPLVSFVITPLALLAAVPGLEGALLPAHAILTLMMGWIESMATWPLAVWQQAAAPWWWVALALAGAVWMLVPARVPIRWAGALLFLPMLAWPPDRPPTGAAWVTVLDVGQGLAVHLQTRSHDAVFDTGPGFTTETDAGNRLLVPYLRAQGVARLDTLIVSHGDSDHAGGALSVLRALPVDQVLHSMASDSTLLTALSSFAPERRCRAGQQWEWDAVRLSVLHPEAFAESGRRNAVACVLRIEVDGHAMLLPSDIEAAQESALVRRRDVDDAAVRADVLVAPHHGSKTSSTAAFIDAVAPATVIFPVGYRNSYGHPADEVSARYAQRNVTQLRTDRDGAVIVKLESGVVGIERERLRRPRYWYGG